MSATARDRLLEANDRLHQVTNAVNAVADLLDAEPDRVTQQRAIGVMWQLRKIAEETRALANLVDGVGTA